MRILHIIDTLNIGGAENVCINLISLLLDAGHQADCMVISAKGPMFDKIDKRSKAFFLDRKSKSNPLTMRKCALIASGYDIIHVHMRHTWAYVKLSCLLFAKSNGLVFHDHYGDIAIDRKATFRLKGLLKPEAYIGVSRELTEWAIAELKISLKSAFLLRNTIVPRYDDSDKYKGDWIMVSNLRPTKNIMFAIKMANMMHRRLVIFGNHDGSEYASGIVNAVIESEYVEIIQNETDIQIYLGNFTLGIHTSFSETGPLVLLEYMAHGLPFITSKCGEVVDQVKQEFPNFIASSFNQEEWKLKIEFIEHEKKINGEKLNQQLKTLYAEKFSPKKYLDQCLKIYQSVLTS